MASTPLREKVQLWFHFLCLAHKSKDPDLKAVLEANKEMYVDWGDFTNSTWTAWWKDHAFLFYVERMIQLQPGTVVPPNRFVFSIPVDRTKPKQLNSLRQSTQRCSQRLVRLKNLSLSFQ